MTDRITAWVKELQLQAHPEGGFYKESYRSADHCIIAASGAERSFSTAIYFLLTSGSFSAFHRIKSDEVWHFYDGDPMEVIEITPDGRLSITELGGQPKVYQHLVKAGVWFGSRVKAGSDASLVGCTVSPGFDFADFELADRKVLEKEFPQHAAIIRQLTRE